MASTTATDLKFRAWAVVLKKKIGPIGLPVISEAKPSHYDKRFCKVIRVEIREVKS